MEIKQTNEAIIFLIDGEQYSIALKSTNDGGKLIPSVVDVETYFNKIKPEITPMVSECYFNYLWGGLTFRKINTNPWGWNGGRNYNRHSKRW